MGTWPRFHQLHWFRSEQLEKQGTMQNPCFLGRVVADQAPVLARQAEFFRVLCLTQIQDHSWPQGQSYSGEFLGDSQITGPGHAQWWLQPCPHQTRSMWDLNFWKLQVEPVSLHDWIILQAPQRLWINYFHHQLLYLTTEKLDSYTWSNTFEKTNLELPLLQEFLGLWYSKSF